MWYIWDLNQILKIYQCVILLVLRASAVAHTKMVCVRNVALKSVQVHVMEMMCMTVQVSAVDLLPRILEDVV